MGVISKESAERPATDDTSRQQTTSTRCGRGQTTLCDSSRQRSMTLSRQRAPLCQSPFGPTLPRVRANARWLCKSLAGAKEPLACRASVFVYVGAGVEVCFVGGCLVSVARRLAVGGRRLAHRCLIVSAPELRKFRDAAP